MNSLSVNFRGISFLSTVKQWLLHAQIYCTSYALADENTSLRQNRTLEAEAGLFPAVPMLWAIRRKDLHFLSVYVFVRLSNPHSSLRDSACQLWSLSEKTVFASGHHYPPELSSTADANYRKKSWKFTRHCVLFFLFFFLTCGYNKGDAPLLEKIHIQENQPGTSLNPWIDFKE